MATWQKSMDDNESVLIDWVKKENVATEVGDINAATTNQGTAAAIREELSGLWCPGKKRQTGRDMRIHKAALRAKRVRAKVAAPTELEVTGAGLKGQIRQGVGKAAGADQWKADDLNDLPVEAFEDLAELWNLCLEGAKLPRAWCRVRVVTIPKDGGGYRGLSIASHHVARRNERHLAPVNGLG